MTDTTMPKLRSELNDDIDLVYVLGKHGWSDLYIIIGQTTHAIRITHIVRDPISDLIELCCAILRGEEGHQIRLYDEPGATLLDVSRRRDLQHILSVRLYQTYGWDEAPSSSKPEISFDIKVSQFLALFYHQFDKLASLCGEKSYAKDRAAFPYAEFQAFRELWSA